MHRAWINCSIKVSGDDVKCLYDSPGNCPTEEILVL